jgi:hypothetical protein
MFFIFCFCLLFPLGYTFDFWMEKQKLRLLKNDFVTGHFLLEKVIRIWSWEWSILSWQCSVWKCVQSLQICAVTPKPHTRPHGAMCRISLFCLPSLITHSYSHTWFWDSYYHWIYHSDLSCSFSALWWRKCKNTPIGFDMSVCPSARNNSQPSFHKCLHIFTNIAVFGTNNKRDSSNLETVRRNATQLITQHAHFPKRYIHSAALNRTTCLPYYIKTPIQNGFHIIRYDREIVRPHWNILNIVLIKTFSDDSIIN